MKGNFIYAALLLFGTFISAVSQVLLKKAAMKTYPSRIREYLNASVSFAYLVFMAATVMTVYSYRGLDVSQGTLLETTSYIFVFAFDVMIFHQKITGKKIWGTVLIIAGILLTVCF